MAAAAKGPALEGAGGGHSLPQLLGRARGRGWAGQKLGAGLKKRRWALLVLTPGSRHTLLPGSALSHARSWHGGRAGACPGPGKAGEAFLWAQGQGLLQVGTRLEWGSPFATPAEQLQDLVGLQEAQPPLHVSQLARSPERTGAPEAAPKTNVDPETLAKAPSLPGPPCSPFETGSWSEHLCRILCAQHTPHLVWSWDGQRHLSLSTTLWRVGRWGRVSCWEAPRRKSHTRGPCPAVWWLCLQDMGSQEFLRAPESEGWGWRPVAPGSQPHPAPGFDLRAVWPELLGLLSPLELGAGQGHPQTVHLPQTCSSCQPVPQSRPGPSGHTGPDPCTNPPEVMPIWRARPQTPGMGLWFQGQTVSSWDPLASMVL